MHRLWRRIVGSSIHQGLAAMASAISVSMVLALAAPMVTAAETDELLKKAAQHFADLEDDEAEAILDDLSVQGNANADVLLGYLYADPLYEGRDYEKAVLSFQKAATSGSSEAVFQLAEARFWPEYSEWSLSPEEEKVRLTSEEALNRLQQVTDGDHFAARWRLAYLCTFGGYDCGEEATDKALKGAWGFRGNLRTIVGAYHIIEFQRLRDENTSENAKSLKAFLALGFADADPFVAALASESAWQDSEANGQCPEPISLEAAGRLLALEGNVVVASDVRAGFERCFDAQQAAVVREDLVSSLDKLARAYGNQSNWHLQTCYRNPEAPDFGDCLIHAVQHHYFACTKLSMIDHFRRQFEIYYASSKRYARCREHMLTAQGQ